MILRERSSRRPRGPGHGEATEDEPEGIARTDDLHVSRFREDGTTCGTPTRICSVIGGDLDVRTCRGTNSRGYRAALEEKEGRITAARIDREVAFEPVGGAIGRRERSCRGDAP